MINLRSHAIARLIPADADALFEPISYAMPPGWRTAHPAPSPLTGWGGRTKRLLDIVLALLVLPILAAAMLVVAVAIRCDSPGPVLFRQERVGLHNRRFALLKFRTMYHGASAEPGCRQATRHDPRITRVGHFLRCTSLDELPQVFNVLRGDMSIVGPRPHAPGTRAGGRLFEDVTPRYADRHMVRPGITGLAQVRGWRGETDIEEKLLRRVESDLEYIQTWSLRLDFLITWRTIFTVLRMRNAY
ncbi:MAG: exopolysaccharide biosynthesis polyprenyl glycosylphosphotransferase [Acetobacteraceae bacterium]|nr:exopolysaccharide biosynthesis polyprenyl glycosylphosphotransferase [Acetobacteraceae bacterium]